MASKRQRANGTWEYTFTNKKLLPKRVFLSFDSEQEGDDYAKNLEALLREGIVPPDIQALASAGNEISNRVKTIEDLIKEYESVVDVPDSDLRILRVIRERHGQVKLTLVSLRWCEAWISDMKHRLNLAPSTIKHHVGALARCFDWGENRDITELARNPLRRLSRGYASYNKRDVALAKSNGGVEKVHTKRNRRLESDEEQRIRYVLQHHVNMNEEPLVINHHEQMQLIMEIALETAMRLREIFTLTVDQIDIKNRTIFLDKTKNGDFRQVPLTTVAANALKTFIQGHTFTNGRLFYWYKGESPDDLKHASTLLSQQFARVFRAAGLDDFHFHDFRHEATSRFFERTDMDSIEIAKITGHKDPRMLMIYANLRATKLVRKLW